MTPLIVASAFLLLAGLGLCIVIGGTQDCDHDFEPVIYGIVPTAEEDVVAHVERCWRCGTTMARTL